MTGFEPRTSALSTDPQPLPRHEWICECNFGWENYSALFTLMKSKEFALVLSKHVLIGPKLLAPKTNFCSLHFSCV